MASKHVTSLAIGNAFLSFGSSVCELHWIQIYISVDFAGQPRSCCWNRCISIYRLIIYENRNSVL